MYARRFYRKTPPGYSGVLFAPANAAPTKEAMGAVGMISEEDRALASGQRKVHRDDTRRSAAIGREFIGYLLAPLLRADGITVFPASDGREKEPLGEAAAFEKTVGKEEQPKQKSELYDELTLIGALLFLLGTGLDSESVLILLAVLTLIT